MTKLELADLSLEPVALTPAKTWSEGTGPGRPPLPMETAWLQVSLSTLDPRGVAASAGAILKLNRLGLFPYRVNLDEVPDRRTVRIGPS